MAMELVEFQTLCSLALGETQLMTGHLEAAHALAEGALAHAREHQERGHQAYALCLLGDIAVRYEPPDSESAEAHYEHALALAEALGMPVAGRTVIMVSARCTTRRAMLPWPAVHSLPPSRCTAPWT